MICCNGSQINALVTSQTRYFGCSSESCTSNQTAWSRRTMPQATRSARWRSIPCDGDGSAKMETAKPTVNVLIPDRLAAVFSKLRRGRHIGRQDAEDFQDLSQ